MLLSTQLKIINLSGMAAIVLPSVWAIHNNTQRQASGISWFDCPDSDNTQCAFFSVPRDYSNPSDDDMVSVFMRKFSATVSAENRLGSMLTNPGGPGGSGSDWIASSGKELSTLFEGRYDIIGFDPRGVNLTWPPTACYETESKLQHMEYQLTLHGVPFPHSSVSDDRKFVKKLSALQAGYNAACVQNGDHKMLESVGTASVVQDMVRMVEALGEDGLNYLGYSYGTVLGATFAAMRPDLVKRMVLDGVVNAESYFNDALQWGRDSIADSHKTLTGLLSTCAEAGSGYCGFGIPPGSSNITQTTESLRKALAAIYNRLDEGPILVADSSVGPGAFTASDLQRLLLSFLYTPGVWRSSMGTLTRLEQGDASVVYDLVYYLYTEIKAQPYFENTFGRSMQRDFSNYESFVPIFCGDVAPTNISLDAYTDYYREMGKISPWRYTGPWTVAKGLKKTRFPILFMSLDADPVTPLPSAIKMSEGFGNDSAVLLVQKGYGHCTTAHPSLCTYKHMRDYFLDGKVPAYGTRCTPEPGFPYHNSKRAQGAYDKREDRILGALEKLRKSREKFDRRA